MKKLLCLLLAAAMVLSLAPVRAFASESAPTAPAAVRGTVPETTREALSKSVPVFLPEAAPEEEEGPVLEPIPPETRSNPAPDLPDRIYTGQCGDGFVCDRT